jgi:hypothetical protein
MSSFGQNVRSSLESSRRPSKSGLHLSVRACPGWHGSAWSRPPPRGTRDRARYLSSSTRELRSNLWPANKSSSYRPKSP